jgi:hypothetical protein
MNMIESTSDGAHLRAYVDRICSQLAEILYNSFRLALWKLKIDEKKKTSIAGGRKKMNVDESDVWRQCRLT